jgi:hypothetical protein
VTDKDDSPRAEAVLTLFGRCPGLKLEDLNIIGYARWGIDVFNCEGSSDRRILFAGLNFNSPKDAAAVFFEVRSAFLTVVRKNGFVTFRKCTFAGEGVKIKADPVAIDRNTIEFPDGVSPVP